MILFKMSFNLNNVFINDKHYLFGGDKMTHGIKAILTVFIVFKMNIPSLILSTHSK